MAGMPQMSPTILPKCHSSLLPLPDLHSSAVPPVHSPVCHMPQRLPVLLDTHAASWPHVIYTTQDVTTYDLLHSCCDIIPLLL